jgi:hypothetical protein
LLESGAATFSEDTTLTLEDGTTAKLLDSPVKKATKKPLENNYQNHVRKPDKRVKEIKKECEIAISHN